MFVKYTEPSESRIENVAAEGEMDLCVVAFLRCGYGVWEGIEGWAGWWVLCVRDGWEMVGVWVVGSVLVLPRYKELVFGVR